MYSLSEWVALSLTAGVMGEGWEGSMSTLRTDHLPPQIVLFTFKHAFTFPSLIPTDSPVMLWVITFAELFHVVFLNAVDY